MSLPAPTTTSDLEVTDKLEAAVSASMPSTSEADDPAALENTVSIELNFKAFADHVSPTEHAKRVTSHLDPSIQTSQIKRSSSRLCVPNSDDSHATTMRCCERCTDVISTFRRCKTSFPIRELGFAMRPGSRRKS
jgi:hypothetical protein